MNFDAQHHLTTPLPGELLVEGKRPVFYTGIEVLNLIQQAYQIFLSLIQR